MNEEYIIIGKDNPYVDPVLHLWHWPIAVYLFLGGLAAGLLFFSSFYHILGKAEKMPTAMKWASIIAPPAIIIGLVMLFFDLHAKALFWRLYTTVRLTSPMSWGAWTLLIITPLSILWAFRYYVQWFPRLTDRLAWMSQLEAYLDRNRTKLAWPLMTLAIVLGVYTGILLSAFNARPLWNTSALGFLFLVSGLSTAAALIQGLSRSEGEKRTFRYIDMGLILTEILLITHVIMGLLAGPQVQVEAAQLLLSGPFAFGFWFFVIFLGLVLPALFEVLEQAGRKIPAFVVPTLVLLGGLLFRMIMIHAGQISSYT